QCAYDAAERVVADLDQRVQVVGHPAESVNAGAELRDDFRHDLVQHPPVRRARKQRFAMIPAEGHVIETARYVQPGSPGHRRRPGEVWVRLIEAHAAISGRTRAISAETAPGARSLSAR